MALLCKKPMAALVSRVNWLDTQVSLACQWLLARQGGVAAWCDLPTAPASGLGARGSLEQFCNRVELGAGWAGGSGGLSPLTSPPSVW